MSIQHQQYISLDECIYSYISESEQSNHKYFKLRDIAYRGMTELGLDFFYQVISFKLPVNDNLTVDLPANYLQYSKIGVLNDRGEVIPLHYNSKLTTYADLLPNRIGEKTQDNTLLNFYNPASPIFYNYWSNGDYVNLYGLPSGAPFVGSFKVDNANGVILLDETFFYPYIILECICSPSVNEEINCPVPIQFKEAMIAYLSWKDIKSLPNTIRGNNLDKRSRRSDFFNERRLAIDRWKPFYIEEAYQSSQEMTRLTVKI